MALLQPDFYPHDRSAYNVPYANATLTYYLFLFYIYIYASCRCTSWLCLKDLIVSQGISNADGWLQSNGDYGKLARYSHVSFFFSPIPITPPH